MTAFAARPAPFRHSPPRPVARAPAAPGPVRARPRGAACACLLVLAAAWSGIASERAEAAGAARPASAPGPVADGAPGRSVAPASARGPIPVPVAELAAELAGGQGAAGLVGLNRPEPPANAYITRDGLDWAWAAPVPAGLTALDLSGPGGWRVPSPAELLSAPRAGDFVFPGANVPLGGEDPASGAAFLMPGPGLTAAAACAAPYFGTEYRHCDWVDGDGVFALPWAGKTGESPFSEQLLVRDARPREMQVAGGGAARVGADAE